MRCLPSLGARNPTVPFATFFLLNPRPALLAQVFDEDLAAQLKIIVGDATDAGAVARAVEGADTVIEALANQQRPEAMAVLVAAVKASPHAAFVSVGGAPALQAAPGEALEHDDPGMRELQALHLGMKRLMEDGELHLWTQVVGVAV
jgi:putative NADH-flavin reductase